MARAGSINDSTVYATALSPLGSKLTRTPLPPPLVVTGGFGEYRIGHFHAGFDFSTGRQVGKPVRAPESGWVERVRCSGVGYGRSVYLHAADGRIFQLGHLDAFAPAIDAYVRKAQAVDGQYEQDLWPKPDELPVKAGSIVAWSGESGAGGPHLHFEIRRGDIAYHPQRAGLVVTDHSPPSIPRVTLEPLDDSSAVQGIAGPVTIAFGSRTAPDTVRAIGRLRVVVDARDGVWSGVDRMVPWSVSMTWRGRTTECRFDSVSWATDMPEGDYVHDAGRVTGSKGLVLWAPRGYRPRFLRSDAPLTEDAGIVILRPTDAASLLEVQARDLGGNSAKRTIVLLPGSPPPRPQAGWWKGDTTWAALSGTFASLPGGQVRWSIPSGMEPGGMELQVGPTARRATRAGDVWCATFALPSLLPGRIQRIAVSHWGAGDAPAEGGSVAAVRLGRTDSLVLSDAGRVLTIPAGALFEDGLLFATRRVSIGSSNGMTALTSSWRVEPSTLPMRWPARVQLAVPPGVALDHVGLCRGGADGWSWLGGVRDSVSRTVTADTRALGAFQLFRDTAPPRVTLGKPPARAVRKPYSRWALEASVQEEGSGLNARASWFEVDGARVPTEWDPEVGRLRWRPAVPPRPGKHQVVVIATDRAGNPSRTEGTFRVASPK